MKQPTTSSGYAAERSNSTASKANRPSLLLTNDENDQLFRILGRRCQTLSTAVVQLYTTQSPAHTAWVKRSTGALCFVKDNIRKSYFFRLYCFKINQLAWEQELYEKIEVTQPKPYFITFEGQDGIVGFNFATDDEATAFMNTTQTTLHNRNRRRDERNRRPSNRKEPPPARPPPLQGPANSGAFGGGGDQIEDAPVTYRSKQPFTSHFTGLTPAFQQQPQQQLPLVNQSHQKPRKVRGMGKLQKSDIGTPSNFKHVTHVGWDPQNGFDLIGEEESLKPFFKKAGVQDQHLKDRETCAFIYDFIQTNNVLDTVKTEQSSGRKKPPAPPPVPSAVAPTQAQQPNSGRNPPPPPPHRALPPLPPTTPPKVSGSGPPPSRPPPLQQQNQHPTATAPPPPAAPAPPPPPPPPPSLPAASGAPLPPPPPSSLKPLAPGMPNTGVTESRDPRADLMESIRNRPIGLRPVKERELGEVIPNRNSGSGSGDVGTDALAEALRRALAERGRAIRSSDDDDSDSKSNNSDWDE
uniref:Putative actin regulatory protein n=1 Tax=Anopheles marajoara TaxID=58244 RepID=A0A2M4BKH2_9DIPT